MFSGKGARSKIFLSRSGIGVERPVHYQPVVVDRSNNDYAVGGVNRRQS